MAATTALPTLSQVQTLDTAYLREAAEHWTGTANLWEQAFTEVHERMSTPGGTRWEGEAAAAAQERSYLDLVKVRGGSDRLHDAAAIARRGDQQLRACKEGVLEAVDDARADGFSVGEDYSVTDRLQGGTSEFRAARLAAAQGYASFISHRVAALVTSDQQLSTQITAATKDIDALTFHEKPGPDDTVVGDKHHGIQPVDQHTFKDAPNPEPDPPPGGWSSDPLMRAAQKIAYGHAWAHWKDVPGMTRDKLADLVHNMFTEDPRKLKIGLTDDGAPVLYDPKTNVMVIRDPNGADCGTVFKPNDPANYTRTGGKMATEVTSIPPGQLADGPLPAPAEPRPAPPQGAGEPAPPKPPVEPPPVKPSPGSGKGGGPMPGLPFGGGLPWDSPATGPHVIHPHEPGQHHRMPLLGELPDDYDG
jgi:hypothetical protein